MVLKELVQINGVSATENLTTYKIHSFDLQDGDSGDGQNGYTYYNLVRADKFQLELAWTGISEDYKNALLNAIAQCSEIPVRFSYAGTLDASFSGYRGDRTLEMFGFKDSTGEILWNLAFNMIEQ